MRKKTASTQRYISVCIFSLFLTLCFTGWSPALGATDTQKPAVRETAHNWEIHKILPVLEDKIHDGKLLEKTKEKVYSMGDSEVRLAAALCEKISGGGETISSDIAFFLVTALIVLS